MALLALGFAPIPGAASAAEAEPPTEAVERGRRIFQSGTTGAGPEIRAAVGAGGFEVSAEVLPCGSCHGPDGRGRPEGGVAPADLRWDVLRRPRSAGTDNRPPRPGYDEASLLKAVTMGIDPGGRSLDDAMPRYRLSHRDADDLMAFLHQLGTEAVPGVTDEALRIGTLLPPGPAGEKLGAVLRGYFAAVNGAGGVFGRRLELVTVEPPELRQGFDADALRKALEEAEPFALVAAAIHGQEQAVAEVLEELTLPLVGPFHRRAWLPMPPNRYVFYLYGGVEEQGRVLVDFFAELPAPEGETGVPQLLVVHGREEALEASARGAEEQARRAGVTVRRMPLGQAGLPEAAAGASAVLFLAYPGDAVSFPWSKLPSQAAVLAPGSVLDPKSLALAAAGRPLYGAFPALPSDLGPAGQGLLETLARQGALGADAGASEIAALSAAVALVSALRKAGRGLDRPSLVEALESFYRLETGLSPPLTFGPNRRLGAPGARVVRIDAARGSFSLAAAERVVPR